MTEPDTLRVAVLLSGEGTSLENLFERIESGALDARIVAVISSKERAGGLERARRRGVVHRQGHGPTDPLRRRR